MANNSRGTFKRTNEYTYTHYWLYETFGKADHCENDETHKTKRFEWANLSHKYLRERKDWKMLCVSCHRKMDVTDRTRYLNKIRAIGNTSRRKRVFQLTTDGIFVGAHESVKVAAETVGCLRSGIVNCLSGRAKSAGGWRWAY